MLNLTKKNISLQIATTAITHHSSIPDSGYGCGTASMQASTSFLQVHLLEPSTGPNVYPRVSSLDAHGRVLIHRTATLEQCVMEDKCASYFVSIEESSQMCFIEHLKALHQMENAFLYLLPFTTSLSCPSLCSLRSFLNKLAPCKLLSHVLLYGNT